MNKQITFCTLVIATLFLTNLQADQAPNAQAQTGKFQIAEQILGNPGTVALLKDPRTESILRDPIAIKVIELKALVDDAKTKQSADTFNLCDIHVPGTNLFCAVNKQIPRFKMPQLSGKPVSGSLADKLLTKDKKGEVDASQAFVNYLLSKPLIAGQAVMANLGNKAYAISCPKQIAANELKATQSDLIGSKVAGMWWALSKNPNWQAEQLQQCGPSQSSCKADVIPPMDTSSTKGITAPIFVSSDNYILDGHHRWATIIAASRFFPNVTMCVRQVNAPITELLNEANNFTAKFGIPNEGGTLPAPQASAAVPASAAQAAMPAPAIAAKPAA